MQNARLRTLIRFTPSIVIMLVIFYFSNQPAAISNSQSEFFSGNLNISWLSDHQLFVAVRKAAHALIYACLGLTLLLGFWYFKNRAKWSISMALFYAISDEFHQTLIQGRSGQMSDVLLDSISATLAICIFLKIFSSLKYFHKKSIHQNSFTS